MERSLQYEPSEFEIIETIEYEEELQRPEELRFFTLEEQLTDYFQKVLPKKKHVLKAEKVKIKTEVDRIKKIYDDIIVLTDTDYRVDTDRKDVNVPWLKPIYGSFEYDSYSYAEKILPLFSDTAKRTPNAYPLIVTALPKPYRSEGAVGVPVVKTTELVDDEGLNEIKALETYSRTKRIFRDDGTTDVIMVPILNTSDDIRRIGFFIDKRPLDIANPLMDHPFLSSNKPSKVLTSEPLLDVFPTIEAIVSHAVPVTKDPYGIGKDYLSLYDVKLSQVRWNSWKSQFPPVETISSPPPPISVTFPGTDDPIAPSDRVQRVYNSKWMKAVYPRLWLMSQEDAGRLVMKMLLSEAGEFGVIAPDLINDRPEVQLPASTPAECLETESFEKFLASGIYRPPGICAPSTYVVRERQEVINKGKKAWTETTQTNIQREYVALFKYFQPVKDKFTEHEYEKVAAADVSELRENVLVILKDDTLFPPDKSYNIRLLTKEITPLNRQYLDANGIFVICEHTLSLLDGDLETDRFKFYNEWTTTDDGFRTCKYCSEQINNDIFVAQGEYDDDGRLIVSHDILTSASGESQPSTFASSLSQLKNAFDLNNAGESVLYLLLAQLQVLPNESQLIPILSNIRKGSVTAKKLPPPLKNRFEGQLGIAGTVVLLQIHNPFLLPRRSFGSKIVKLSGFPRDTDDSSDAPVLNLLINILKDTLEAFPTTFKEPVATILREVSRNTKKVKDECVKFILQAYNEFKVQFESAKERAQVIVETVQANTITLPAIVPKKIDFKPGDSQGLETFAECTVSKPGTVIVGKLNPTLTQTFPSLQKTKPKDSAIYIDHIEVKTSYLFPADKDIERAVKAGFPKNLKLELIRKFVDSDTDGVALLSLLGRLVDILAPSAKGKLHKYRKIIGEFNSFENPSLFRDAVKGLIYNLFHDINDDDGMIEIVKTAMTRDLTMNMILLTKEKAEKEVETLRAIERETLKRKLKGLTDNARETIKLMLDIGIAEYLITNEDRRMFAKELQMKEKINDEDIVETDVPEEGFTDRDYVDGEPQMNENNQPMEPDRGDYGDVRNRPEDDYSRVYDFEDVGNI
jgi:hypothetical protein